MKIHINGNYLFVFHGTFCCISVFIVAYILLGAVIFSAWEQWTFLEGAYFSFITLTTIGIITLTTIVILILLLLPHPHHHRYHHPHHHILFILLLHHLHNILL